MNAVINIIIADDHTLFIDGLRLLLKDEASICITDVANTGKELLQVLDTQPADIILLDLNMPEMNGLQALPFIRKKTAARVIILSTYNESHLIAKARASGANGYLLKNESKENLLMAIRLVHGGHECYPLHTGNKPDAFEEQDGFLKQFQLTKREKEILHLIKDGNTNQQIASELYLSVYTVETHRKNIMQKLEIKSTASLFKFIADHNL